MAVAKNKVKFGISNVHIALKNAEGTYDAPVKFPGAVSITLTPQGEIYVFYADNIKYYQMAVNNGYTGELEMAEITDMIRTMILGEELTETDKVLLEKVNSSSQEFALGFQIEGDVKASKFWFYNCVANRPETAGETKEESIDVQTDKLTISTTAGEDGIVRAKTTEDTSSTVYEKWFEQVYMPFSAA